ncbi:MAG: TolB-like 6-bladed beta-propeller domain-containing protein [Prevotellaceae bacterium]|jgi:hypothetical protein|nr:TolB-like 6-bladed beta-propeller domain-containing protein [Prevotellaceae bacterium]
MKKILFLLLFLSCIGCRYSNNNYKLLIHSDLKLNSEYIGKGGAIIAYQGGIVGIEESGSLSPFFAITTNGESHSLTHFGNRGQGPDDFVHPYPIQYIDEDVFGVYDMMLKQFKEVSVPQKEDAIVTRNNVSLASQPAKAIKTAYNQYLGLSFQEGLFILMDEKGEELSTFFEYPYRNKDEKAIKNPIRAMAYQGIIAANPQKTKCVYASLNGEIIHFYDIRKDRISLIHKIEKQYPAFKPEDNGSGNYSAMASWDNTVGYISIAATDKHVYALYSGKSLKELKEGNSLEFVSREVRIFDWTGNRVETYSLDVSCKYIGVSNDEKTLWAIALAPDITPVYFDLADNNKKSIGRNIPGKGENSISAENNLLSPLSLRANAEKKIDPDEEKKKNILNLGKMHTGEEKKLTIPLNLRVKSISATSTDISLRDSAVSANESIIYISITKQRPGVFTDTISISTGTKQILIEIAGEVLK